MRKTLISIVILMIGLNVGCKEERDTCAYEGRDSRRQTVKVAQEARGRVTLIAGENSDFWAIVSEEGIIGQNTPIYDGPDIIVPCNLPDTLKEVDLRVVFSGELKSACDDFASLNSFSTIYYSTLSQIRKTKNE